jgi:hypothetical protein
MAHRLGHCEHRVEVQSLRNVPDARQGAMRAARNLVAEHGDCAVGRRQHAEEQAERRRLP